MFLGRTVVHAVSPRPVTSVAWARYEVSLDICGRHGGSRRSVSPNDSGFACQYHSTNALYPSLYTCCCYQKVKQTNFWTFLEQCISEIGEHWIEKFFPIFECTGWIGLVWRYCILGLLYPNTTLLNSGCEMLSYCPCLLHFPALISICISALNNLPSPARALVKFILAGFSYSFPEHSSFG